MANLLKHIPFTLSRLAKCEHTN